MTLQDCETLTNSKVLCKWLQTKDENGNSEWTQRKNDYLHFIGGENQHSEDFLETLALTLAFCEKVNDTVEYDFLNTEFGEILAAYSTKLEVWRKSFRPKGTHQLDSQVATLCEKALVVIGKFCSSESVSSAACDRLAAIQQALQFAVITQPLSNGVLQSASDLLMSFKETGSQHALLVALKALIAATSEISTAMRAAKHAYDRSRTNNPQQILELLKQCLVISWTQYVKATRVGAEGADVAMDFFKALSDDPAVVEVCGGDAAMSDILTMMNLTGLLILAEKHARELDLVKDKTGGTVLPKLVETMKALENSSKTVAAFHNPILKEPFDELRVHANAVVDMHRSKACSGATALVEKFVSTMADKGKKLQPVSAGDENSKSWYATAPANVQSGKGSCLDWLANRVEKLKPQECEKRMQEALKVIRIMH